LSKNREAKGKGVGAPGPAATETAATVYSGPLGRQTLNSYEIFELCIQRARNLVKLHEAAHGKAGKPEKYTSDAHRAAIVLAISALDAFVRDFVIARAMTLLASRSAPLPVALSTEIKRFLKDDALIDAARQDNLLERVEKAFRAEFEKRSFQGTKNIEEQLKIVGYEDIFHEVAITSGLNEDNLRADLNRLTDRRHAIAHRGDYDLTEKPPRENVVTKKDAEDCIKLMCRIAKHMHGLEVRA
jgi:hypothetical protein